MGTIVVLGKRSGKEELILEAIHCRWSTAFFRGDVAKTLADAREGIKQYNPERHSGLSSEFGGHDPGVCAYTVSGFSYAQSGAPRKATDNVENAIELAQKLNQQSRISFAIVKVSPYTLETNFLPINGGTGKYTSTISIICLALSRRKTFPGFTI